MNITIIFPQDKPPALPRIRPWGDPIMRADGYSTYIRTVNGQRYGQFSHVIPYMLDDQGNWLGSWSANYLKTAVTHQQMLDIADMQTADEFTVNQKMSWLTNGGDGTWGAPIKCTGDWQKTTDAHLIGACWANTTIILADERKQFTIHFNSKVETVWMRRVKLPQVQECTAVGADDTPRLPKGKIILPVQMPGASNWIFERWLVV